jgi:prepilin peptidase CpaA
METLSVTLLPCMMIAAAISDISTYRIPNWLTALIAILFLPMAFLTNLPFMTLLLHLAVGVGLFAVGYILFELKVFGGGDAKLMAAAGLWFGAWPTAAFIIMTGIFGGLVAVAYGGWYLLTVFLQQNHHEKISELGDKAAKQMPKLPYGLAFAGGAILAFPETWWMNFTRL